MAVGPAIALDADGADVGEEDDGALPDLGVEAGLGQLLAGDRVGTAEDRETVLGDLADDADAQSRSGERLAGDDRLGHAELAADRAHLVLEQGAQGFDELELDVLGQTADVVVALDVRRSRTAAGFDDVGVEGALDEEADLLALVLGLADEFGPACSKVRMNSRPMIFRFSSGSVTPASWVRNRSRASTVTSRTPIEST